jgi:hypothetical protein
MPISVNIQTVHPRKLAAAWTKYFCAMPCGAGRAPLLRADANGCFGF